MKAIRLLSIALIMGTLSSCNDEFMERTPQSEIAASNFFNSEEDLRMYCYGLTDTPGYDYVGDAGTDIQATTDNVEIKNIMTSNNPTSTTIASGWDWKRLYDLNYFLEHCEQAKCPDDVKDHYRGVVRYYRAKFYMNMVKRFSDVPWYDKVLATDDPDLYKKRSPRDSVVMHIFDDFRYASQHVKDKQPQGAVDKWIVTATMAREALYEGTYRKYHPELGLESSANEFLQLAASTCEDIMQSGRFSIYHTGNPAADYAALFGSTDLSGNQEIIQAHYYQKGVADNGIWGAYMFGNYIPCPTKDLVQTYLMADGSYYSHQANYQTNQFVEEFEGRDPRMAQTLAYPGWELKSAMSYAPGAGLYVQSLNKNFSGYHQIKGFPNSKDDNFYLSIDYPCIRYAEVLLVYAEAKAELGQISQEILDKTVNQLRARAGMPNLAVNCEADPFMQAKFPKVSPVLLEIRRERTVELAFEGFRFDDLMRWHAGKLLEKEPEGLYFPALGKYDLTGDAVPDIMLIPSSEALPAEDDREVNALGTKLVYYRTGSIDDRSATVYLTHGTHGNILTIKDMGTFTEPRDYYRPVPRHEVDLNPALLPQLFGWTD